MVAETRGSRKVFGVWLAIWGLCTAGLLAYSARPSAETLVDDEFYWIGSAYYFDLAFNQRDGSNPDWGLLPARENPPVAKYVIGAGLALAGQQVTSIDLLGSFYTMFEAVPGAWGQGPDRAKREAVVARMTPELHQRLLQSGQYTLDRERLGPARWTMVACVALTSLLVFLAGAGGGRALAGLLSSQVLLLHPVVIQACNQVGADAVALLFSAAAGWLAVRFLRPFVSREELVPRRVLFLAGAMGLTSALACGAKMNSLVVVAAFGLAVLGFSLRAGMKRDRRAMGYLLGGGLLAAVVGLAVFVLLNPAIWRDLSGGLAASVREHALTEKIQAQFLAGHLVAVPEKIQAVAALAYFGFSGTAVMLAALIIRGWGFLRSPGGWFLLGWWVLAAVAVTAWIPFPWPRYVLPLVLPSALLWGEAVAQVLESATARFRANHERATGG